MVKVVEDGGGRSGATSTILHQLPPSSTTCFLSHRRPRSVNYALFFERRLRCGETGDRHTERRAGHIVHAHVVTELHRRRLAAVLPADADLELGPRSPAEPDRQLDELADALLVEHLEWVVLQDPVLHVKREEPAG